MVGQSRKIQWFNIAQLPGYHWRILSAYPEGDNRPRVTKHSIEDARFNLRNMLVGKDKTKRIFARLW